MPEQPIRFDDGAAYERLMGVWSASVGAIFLDWLSPTPGQKWIDVGCGNGAFTERIIQRCAPSEVYGIDPSQAQLAYAAARPGTKGVVFQQGDATQLPYDSDRFDAAIMALVISFLPDPAKGIAEMARVVRPAGLIAAYMWAYADGGSPISVIMEEVSAMGFVPTRPPSPWASAKDGQHKLWMEAGLERIEAKTISVRRDFSDFDSFWTINTAIGPGKATLDRMAKDSIAEFRQRVRARVSPGGGAFTVEAWANAVKGFVSK